MSISSIPYDPIIELLYNITVAVATMLSYIIIIKLSAIFLLGFYNNNTGWVK